MLPFNLNALVAPVLSGPDIASAPILPPIVKGFDPRVERLSFLLDHDDAAKPLALHDLDTGDGVRVEVGDRLLVTLLGCVADDIPPDCLTFDFVD